MGDLFTNHWPTLVLALAALVVWTIGNVIKKKLLIYIGIGLCVFAVLTYTSMFDFLFEV